MSSLNNRVNSHGQHCPFASMSEVAAFLEEAGRYDPKKSSRELFANFNPNWTLRPMPEQISLNFDPRDLPVRHHAHESVKMAAAGEVAEESQ